MSSVPERGDVVRLNFDPQKGKEIQETRPALVVSPKIYNEKVGLALFMPIMSKVKGYPFEHLIDFSQIQGVVLCDQLRSMDWRSRNAHFLAELPPIQMDKILAKFKAIILVN